MAGASSADRRCRSAFGGVKQPGTLDRRRTAGTVGTGPAFSASGSAPRLSSSLAPGLFLHCTARQTSRAGHSLSRWSHCPSSTCLPVLVVVCTIPSGHLPRSRVAFPSLLLFTVVAEHDLDSDPHTSRPPIKADKQLRQSLPVAHISTPDSPPTSQSAETFPPRNHADRNVPPTTAPGRPGLPDRLYRLFPRRLAAAHYAFSRA